MMTHHQRQHRFHARALALAAAALLALAPSARAEDPGGLAPGGAGTTGTLPVTSGGTGGLPLPPFIAPYGAMVRKASKPAVSLTGLASELDDLIAAAWSPDGSGWFALSSTAPNGTVTIRYYGNVVVELDRAAFLESQATAALSIAPAFNGGVAAVKPTGMRRTTQVLRTGLQSLQLHRMVRSGLVDDGVSVRALDPGRRRTASLEILALAGRLRIEQSH